jgi:hypothetical protein
MGRVSGDLSGLSAHRAVPTYRVKGCAALCALRNTDAGRGWLRVQVGNPACYFCAVWVPGAVGEWRWRWFDVGQLTDGSGCTGEHPNAEMSL